MSLPNRLVQGMVDELRVRCNEGKDDAGPEKKARTDDDTQKSGDDKTKGCQWEGTLGLWRDEHKKVCLFTPVRCPTRCGKMIPRKDLEQHKQECRLRKVECDICNVAVLHCDLSYHKDYKCPKGQVKCEFCGEEMVRELLGEKGSFARQSFDRVDRNESYGERCTGHYAECPKMILQCEFTNRGCFAEFKREDAAAHHAENAQYHAALVDQTLDRLYNWLDWDFIQLNWSIQRSKLDGSSNKTLKSTVTSGVSQHDLYLKLYLRGPNDPVKVAICSDSMSCTPFHREVRLKNIHMMATDVFLSSPGKFAEIALGEEREIQLNSEYTFEFGDLEIGGDKCSRRELLNLVRESNWDNFLIRARFCVKKTKYVSVFSAN